MVVLTIPSRAVSSFPRICLRSGPTTYSPVEDAMKRTVLIIFAFMLGPIASAQVYTITDLGPLSPTAINTWAQVVGNYDNRAYIWAFGRMHSLGTLPGGTFSWAAAINDFGVVTGTADGQGTVAPNTYWGYSGPSVQCSDLIQPFIWQQKMQGLGTVGPSSDVAEIYCSAPLQTRHMGPCLK